MRFGGVVVAILQSRHVLRRTGVRQGEMQEEQQEYRALTPEEQREFKQKLRAALDKRQAPPKPRKLPRYPTDGWFEEK